MQTVSYSAIEGDGRPKKEH